MNAEASALHLHWRDISRVVRLVVHQGSLAGDFRVMKYYAVEGLILGTAAVVVIWALFR